jgi:hypothetical protein
MRFNFSPGPDGKPVIDLNEASLLQDGGAFASTSFLLVQEDERETAATPKLPNTSKPYTVTMCLNASTCHPVNAEVSFNSYEDCMKALVESLGPETLQNDRRFYRHDDGTGLPYI